MDGVGSYFGTVITVDWVGMLGDSISYGTPKKKLNQMFLIPALNGSILLFGVGFFCYFSFVFSKFSDVEMEKSGESEFFDPFWSFDEDIVVVFDLIQNSFFYEVVEVFESIEVNVEEFVIVNVNIGIGRTLNLFRTNS